MKIPAATSRGNAAKAKSHRSKLRAWPALAVAACALGIIVPIAVMAQRSNSSQIYEIKGVLLEVQAKNLVYADTITMRDEHNHLMTFNVDPEAVTNTESPQTASHLRQHMSLAEPVIVRYRETPKGLVAIRIIDAE
jgi:hypothetical protein